MIPSERNKHQIIKILVRELYLALDLVIDNGEAILWRLETDNAFCTFRCLRRIAVAPTSVIAWRAAFGSRLFAHLGQFFLGGKTVIGRSVRNHLFGDFLVAGSALKLRNRLTVPIKAEPGKAVQNCIHRIGRIALAVRILDAQQHLAAIGPGKQPVEKRRARAANVKITGGRGCKAGYYRPMPCLCHEES